jgi:hypothetical protein
MFKACSPQQGRLNLFPLTVASVTILLSWYLASLLSLQPDHLQYLFTEVENLNFFCYVRDSAVHPSNVLLSPQLRSVHNNNALVLYGYILSRLVPESMSDLAYWA